MIKVYLDHQSSPPVLPQVYEAMLPWFSEYYGNASALHEQGLRAKAALNQSRKQFSEAIHSPDPESILFTSCGTEANNLAVKGTAYALQHKGKHIILSTAEHPSVENSVAFLERQGFTATRVSVDSQGFINPEDIRAAITPETILIATHYANHDIGTIQPVAQIGEIAREHKIQFFVDAAFSAGWLPINVQEMNASLLSLSPHRFYGPKGVGVLYKNRKARLSSIIHGGIQENNFRSGTENIPAIVGGGLAMQIAENERETRVSRLRVLQEKLWKGLSEQISYICLNGPLPGENRHPANLNVSTEFIEGEGQLLLCNAAGIAVASGSSCVSKNLKSSLTLTAIGLDITLAQGNIIFTLGKDNTFEQIDYVVSSFAKIVERLRQMSPMWDAFQKGNISSVIPGNPK